MTVRADPEGAPVLEEDAGEGAGAAGRGVPARLRPKGKGAPRLPRGARDGKSALTPAPRRC
ncbi:MAG: hypothetical protein ACYS47_03875 [Planctomycetota bacterium]